MSDKSTRAAPKHPFSSFLIVIISLFMCSCPSPFIQSPPENARQGFGSFSLRVNTQRTILPDTSPLSGFSVFELIFDAKTDGQNQTVYFADITSPTIILAVGIYDITLNAYLEGDEAAPARLAARGTLTNIAIASGASVSETIILTALRSEGEGTFIWNVAITASHVTGAQMTITQNGAHISGGPVTLNASGVTTGSPTLPSGVYNIRFTLIKDGDVKERAVWNELLYVYAELTSSFSMEFDDEFFLRTHYNVTFVYNDDGETANGLQSVPHGGTLDDGYTPPSPHAYTHDAGLYRNPVPEHYTFGGWFTDNGVFTRGWNFSASPVLNDMTLYAEWVYPSLSRTGIMVNDVAAAVAYVNADAGEYTLFIDTDVSVPPQLLENGANLTIKGIGQERRISLSGNGSLFTVSGINGAAELTLDKNITLAGHADNTEPLIHIFSGAALTMLTDSKITGNAAAHTSAVLVESSTFTMEGGIITGNASTHTADIEGCAVLVDGRFTMSGGSISGNTAALGDVSSRTGGPAYADSGITLSGEAFIGTLSMVDEKPIVIEAGWNGGIGALNMRGSEDDDGDILTTIDRWETRTLVRSAGGSPLTAADVAKIGLGNFITTDGIVLSVSTHYIGSAGINTGKLLTLYGDSYTRIHAFRVVNYDMVIYIYENLTLPVPVTIPANANGYSLTIMSAPGAGTRTITRGASDTEAGGGLFMVSGGAKLIFEDIILDGNNFAGNTTPLVRVNSRGEFTLNAGAALRNNRAADGGGVYLNGAYGTGNTAALTMNAGSAISGNTASAGGGVYASYGMFTMNGGEISGNMANAGGGGVYVGSGTFNMSESAVISGNTASGDGGGVYNNGSSSSYGTFNMSGGSITGNKVSGGDGGGLFNAGTFRVGGASEIHGNTRTNDGSNNNTYLAGAAYIVLGNGTSTTGNVPAPATGMNIHVRTEGEGRVMVNGGANAGHVQNFTADNGDAIGFLSGRLIIGMNVSAEAADFYEKVAAYADAAGNMEIAVNADLILPIPVTVPANANYTLTIKSGSAGTRTITRGISDTGAGSGLFIVSGGAKLLFESIVIDGNHRNAAGAVNANFANNAASLVRVNSRGEFTMNAGAALKNNRAANGGGVYVYDYSGTFTMNGGVISDNTATGGGSGSYGGGVYVSGGMFNMHGGEISGNTATGSSGDSIYGGGVYVSGGTFNMHGGVISGNTASSAYEYGGGGGVYVNGAFNMSGNALISENTASNGGGVQVSGGAFNMIGSAVISDNTASTTHTSTIASGGNGGGVYVGYGTFNMSGNALISGNTASSTYTSYGNGGGVYVSSSSIFNMSGGKIIENRISAASASSGNGGGVFNAGTLRVGGAAEIHGNTKTNDGSGNNAYLAGGNYIVLGDAASTTENVPVPATGMNIHVRTAREDGVLVNSGANAGHVRYFTADNGDTIGYLGGRLIIGMNVSAEAADFYEKVAAYAGATGNMEIAVNADLTLPIPVTVPANADYTLTIKSGSAGTRTITRGTSDTGAGSGLFIVSGGVKLQFEDIIINGNNFSNNAAPLVRVNSRGELTLNAGAALRNNRAADGGAVYLNGAYGTGNTAALTMNAGSEISGNMATSDGGGVYAYYGTFTMNGGVISGNTASGTSIYGRGAGVYVGSNSTFNMGGNAVISGNTASSTSTNYGNGGGVYIYMDGTFNMSGNAVISGNTASSTSASAAASGGNGGGVYVSDGTFNMSGGKIIENKVSSASTSANSGNGGGVYNNGTFRLGGASEIHGNIKTDDGSNNNAYLTGTTHIVLGNGTSTTGNVPAPAAGMNIHVRTAREDGVMVTSGADAGHVPYFTADEAGKQVTLFGVDTLRIQ